MRRSAGMGGGRVMKTVSRAVGEGVCGVKDAISASSSSSSSATRPATMRAVTVPSSSASSTSSPSPTFAAAGWSTRSVSCFCDEDDWETVEVEVEEEEFVEEAIGFSERYVFGRAPSKEEAEEAVSTIQQVFVPVTFPRVSENGCPPLDMDAVDKVVLGEGERTHSTESETDWIEPAVHLFSSQSFQCQEHQRVLDAFHLLQINPSIQKMVVALSSDITVWAAVMNNDVVQEIKKSFYEVENSKSQSSEKQTDIDTATRTLKWIFDSTKAKVVEFLDMISKLVNEIFISREENKDKFDVALKSSFMLSVVVFIVIVVTRIQKSFKR